MDIEASTKCLQMHIHSAIELLFVAKGAVFCNFENQVITVPENSFLIVGSNIAHSIAYCGSSAQIAYLQMDIAKIIGLVYPELDELSFFLKSRDREFLLVERDGELFGLLSGIFADIEEQRPYFELGTMGDFLRLAAHLHSQKLIPDYKSRLQDPSFQKIYPIMEYINGHFPDKLSLEELSEWIHIDKFYLCKLFKKATGMTLTQYINQLRIQHAELLLTTTDRNIADIAAACGFSTAQYFILTFTKAKGCTPHSFRRLRF